MWAGKGICDGAASLVIASEKAVKAHGWTPLARVVSWGVYVAVGKLLLCLPAFARETVRSFSAACGAINLPLSSVFCVRIVH